jgi:nucleoid-associated protein YejK
VNGFEKIHGIKCPKNFSFGCHNEGGAFKQQLSAWVRARFQEESDFLQKRRKAVKHFSGRTI